MNILLSKWLTAAGIAGTLMLGAAPAHAAYTITMVETGGNVVATGSGSINTAGLTDVGPDICATSYVNPSLELLCIGNGPVRAYSGATAPGSFGTTGATLSNSQSGDAVIVFGSTILIKTGYVSGAALSGTTTWNGKTLAGLGVKVGTYTWAFGSGANADSVVLNVQAAPVAAPPPIPGYLLLPGVPNIVSQLKVLDMGSGSGPSMTTCLLASLKQTFGADATYLGQSANGATRVSIGARTISFYPLAASTAFGSGVSLRSDNVQSVGTSCGTFNVVPALTNLADLGTVAAASGLSLQVDASGVFTTLVNGILYVVRPDYFVTQGSATGTPSLAFGTDGVLRFTDSAGNVQILRAAFLDTSGLQAAIGAALGGTVTLQADGSAVFTQINGSQLQLLPEMQLGAAASGLGAANWVNDRANHYLYRIAAYYQGLTAIAR